jgi:hypothetical protein
MKEGAMGNACSMHGRGEKCIENFGWKIWREEISCKV